MSLSSGLSSERDGMGLYEVPSSSPNVEKKKEERFEILNQINMTFLSRRD